MVFFQWIQRHNSRLPNQVVTSQPIAQSSWRVNIWCYLSGFHDINRLSFNGRCHHQAVSMVTRLPPLHTKEEFDFNNVIWSTDIWVLHLALDAESARWVLFWLKIVLYLVCRWKIVVYFVDGKWFFTKEKRMLCCPEDALPTNIFQHCRVGLPAARAGTVEVKVATYLHPMGLQRPSGSNERAQHREGLPPIANKWH